MGPMPSDRTPDRLEIKDLLKSKKSNFDIFGFELDSDDMAAIEGLNQNLRILPLSWDGIYKHPDYPFTSELNDKTVY